MKACLTKAASCLCTVLPCPAVALIFFPLEETIYDFTFARANP